MNNSLPNSKEPLNIRRLLSTSSTDHAFGSSKSLSNTDVISQTSVLSSASCSSSSSSMLSSSCGLMLAKNMSADIRNNTNDKQPFQSMDVTSVKNSNTEFVIKSPEKSCLTKPPPIPPKTSSNSNSLNPVDSSPPALPTTPPPFNSTKSPSIDQTSVILDSIKMSDIDAEDDVINEQAGPEEHDDEKSMKSIDLNKQAVDTLEIINAVIYIDDEDDLSATSPVKIDP